MEAHAALRRLIDAGHPAVSIVTPEESDAIDVARRAACDFRGRIWQWSAVGGLRDGQVDGVQGITGTENPAAALARLLAEREAMVVFALDLADHLGDARTLRALREVIDHCRALGGCVVLIDHADALPGVIRSYATSFDLPPPDDEELEAIARKALRDEHARSPLKVDIAKRTYTSLVRNLRGLSRRQAGQAIRDVVADDRTFDESDLPRVIDRKREMVAADGVLEFVRAPQSLDDVGGLARFKAWLAARERTFEDDAAKLGLTPPRGVLLLGVQGAGKSLSAKAIATAWGRPLLRLDPGSLYDKFVGESERSLRRALHQAEVMAPIILWIDEIEKGFASAASTSSDGGLSRRMFGALLTWLQDHRAPVFVVATANDVQALPPELLRKGRFDEIFFVDLPGPEAREQIIRLHLAKRGQEAVRFDLPSIIAASEGRSGAEIEQAVIAALTEAFAENRNLSTPDVVRAFEESPPLSVTMREQVAQLRSWARDRCVPAD